MCCNACKLVKNKLVSELFVKIKMPDLDNDRSKVRKRDKKRNIFQRFLKSRSGEYFFLKFPVGGVFGAALGYGYYKALFDGAFQENERFMENLMFGTLLFITSFGCASSVQCRCIGLLCLPAMAGRTGKGVLKAVMATWIFAGPIANILSNVDASMYSMTCIARMQSKQMQQFFTMLHAPVSKGLLQIVNDTSLVNDTELILKWNLLKMKADLWAKPREARDVSAIRGNATSGAKCEGRRGQRSKKETAACPDGRLLDESEIAHRFSSRLLRRLRRSRVTRRALFPNSKSKDRGRRRIDVENYMDKLKDIKFEEPGNPAQKLRTDAYDRCIKLFQVGVTECKRLMRKKEQSCRDSIGIPFVGHLLCLVFRATFVCNVVQWFDSWCGEIPVVNETEVNRNYHALSEIEKTLEDEFRTEMVWKVPVEAEEPPVVLTVEEVTDRIERGLETKRRYFHFGLTLFKKLVAVAFILVIRAAKNYNKSFLTDFRFDNLYVTSYFRRKDKERELQGKRCLLPLTKLERRNVVYSRSLRLTEAEKKTVFFRLMKVTAEAILTSVIFFFDRVIYYVLDLIRRHGRMEMSIRGKHVLEVMIAGDGMVAQLLRRLFLPFEDNEYLVDSTSSNIECLPKAKHLKLMTYLSIIALYIVFYFLIFVDAYALRLRHVIAGFAYRRREKKRVIFLYSDLMRRRKNQIKHVQMTVRKLARKYHLEQRYSFAEAMRLSWPRFEIFFRCFGIGRRHCIICDDLETRKRKFVTCRNRNCKMGYCALCWLEVNEKCWACKEVKKPKKISRFGLDDDVRDDELVTSEGESDEDL